MAGQGQPGFAVRRRITPFLQAGLNDNFLFACQAE
jgi:hypothetical protein